jgi:hypothetical protein
MPKILSTPATIVQQQALTADRIEVADYLVDCDAMRVVVHARGYLDAAPTVKAALPEKVITGAPLQIAMASTGAEVVLRALALLGISNSAQIEIAAALAAHPEAAATAYYEGTKAGLYGAL